MASDDVVLVRVQTSELFQYEHLGINESLKQSSTVYAIAHVYNDSGKCL